MDKIIQDYDSSKQQRNQQMIKGQLTAKIDQWETRSIEQIRHSADKARKDLAQLVEQSDKYLSNLVIQRDEQFDFRTKNINVTEKTVNSLKQNFKDFQQELDKLSGIRLISDTTTPFHLIKIESSDKNEHDSATSPRQNAVTAKEKQSELVASNKMLQDGSSAIQGSKPSCEPNLSIIPQSSKYPSITFGLTESIGKNIKHLFYQLMLLNPMDKDGPMSGKCELETDQMEKFLKKTFGFQNISGKYIAQGVKAFQLNKPVRSMSPNDQIHFPSDTTSSFAMTIQEIIDWQRSYKVYAGKQINGMTNGFLQKALQGQSDNGDEAYRMKFVVRISTCPILMEFDVKVIQRSTDEDWPNRIKLVSVTGIDFAGRKHDVGDIIVYISNWKEVFEVDRNKNEPALLNERDFALKRGGPSGILNEDRLLRDLTYMARLRLRACDEEGVQVVVETGIGLGVFSGKHIGVDTIVRTASAVAIRRVLEEDGPSYKNIRAVVFALPIFDKKRSGRRTDDTFDSFAHEFEEPHYTGRIPVLIADQDMHRLTVAIARAGFTVSELNPADSHGVFGEYWQNRGPAVEEKLALTTVGLLVQHHLINPHVQNTNNYYIN
ncbi:unnamed protein product [Adineta steineri]|uniref:Uncharacterized protein n=1 Tax=Adineta steineri TaxID=433720 RepID=A0A814I0C7_9BILA|nr:unnamed protein product [Adineta steineri]